MLSNLIRRGWIAFFVIAAIGLACAAFADGSKLAVGDVVLVAVDGEKDLSKPYQINDSGAILLPVIEPVVITGMNASEAAATVTKAFEKVLVKPQVSVTFIERGKMQVFVVGQVKKPGLAEVGIGDTVVQALAQVGYDDTADLAGISIRRDAQIINLDLSKYLSGVDLTQNASLITGDTIVVPRADSIGNVLVLGQVEKVGATPLKKGMTFKELMGLIGGAKIEADTEKITIKRADSAETIHVDYKRAMDGDPSADVALMPGDTIYVPETETAYFTVMGGVNRPGQYPLKGKLTLSEAIGTAGGAMPDSGDIRKVQLVTKPNGDSGVGVTTNVNLENLLKNNPSGQPLIKRGDVIIVAVHKQKPGLWQVIQSLTPFGWLLR